MESQISQSFSFQRVLRDINCQSWKKYKMSCFEALFAQMFEQKWLLCKIMLCQFLDEKNITSWKTHKKLWSSGKCWIDPREEWGTVKQQWFHKKLCLQGYTKENWPFIFFSRYNVYLSFWTNFGMCLLTIQNTIDLSLTYKKSTSCLNSYLRY